MGLGEKISRLRTEKGLSQGELAAALEVSRQSVSKWETNGSVPELDKLVKLSEIFEISLDELILDKKQTETAAETEPKVIYVERTGPMPAKKVVGIILLCFSALLWLMAALLGDILAGLVLASPFVACGLVCLFVRRHVGLWCCWIVYLFIEIYLRFATGVSWRFVFLPYVYTGGWTIHLIVAWTVMITFVVLTLITALSLRKAWPGSLRADAVGTSASWAVYLLTQVVFTAPVYETGPDIAYSQTYRYVSAVSGWVKNIVLAAAVVFTVRLLRSLWEKHIHK